MTISNHLIGVIIGCALSILPAAAQTSASLPPNTIDCNDWTHNADGSWTAHADAKPFDLGTVKHTTFQASTISPHAIKIGDYDLAVIVDQKCGTSTAH